MNDSPKQERKTVRFAGTKDTADAGSSNKDSGISFHDPNFAKGHVKIPGTRESISLAQADQLKSKSLISVAWPIVPLKKPNQNPSTAFKDVPNKALRIAESTTIRPQEKKPRFFKKFWSFGKRKTHEVDSRQDGNANNLRKAKAALGSLYSNGGYQLPKKEEP